MFSTSVSISSILAVTELNVFDFIVDFLAPVTSASFISIFLFELVNAFPSNVSPSNTLTWAPVAIPFNFAFSAVV